MKGISVLVFTLKSQLLSPILLCFGVSFANAAVFEKTSLPPELRPSIELDIPTNFPTAPSVPKVKEEKSLDQY